VNGTLLKKGKKADYTTEYLGGGKMKIEGSGNYSGSIEVEFKVGGGEDLGKAGLKAGKGQNFNYNGSAFSDKAEGVNHVNVECSKTAEYRFFNNVNKGTAVCVAYGDGVNTTGSKAVKFKIKGAKKPNDVNEEQTDDGGRKVK
ncbi:MAG: hypothetical protein K6B44_12720, partial [Lachnospiraceae bacterium]|nr:hypothetical protein [Lachnospiraceae bacterium]